MGRMPVQLQREVLRLRVNREDHQQASHACELAEHQLGYAATSNGEISTLNPLLFLGNL